MAKPADARVDADASADASVDAKSPATTLVADEDTYPSATAAAELARIERRMSSADGADSGEKGGRRRGRGDADSRRSVGFAFSTLSLDSEEEDLGDADDNQVPPPPPQQQQQQYASPVVKTVDQLKFDAMARRVDRLEKQLEAYEGLQRRLAKGKVAPVESEAAGSQQLIEFFLTEMEKQQNVIARLTANQQVLEQKLNESIHQTHKFHRQQLHRMTNFHEVMQLMEKEFVEGAVLRDEEKNLAWSHQNKKTNAVKRALGEQISDLKTEANNQRRRLEIKFEKRFVDLATENQLLKAENLELKDELQKLTMSTRSNKRTLRMISEEVLKLKRASGPAEVPDVSDELRRLSSVRAPAAEVHPQPPRGYEKH